MKSASNLKLAFQDVFEYLYQYSARSPQVNQIVHLTKALGNFFPECKLTVILSRKLHAEQEPRLGAAIDPVTQDDAEPLPNDELLAILSSYTEAPFAETFPVVVSSLCGRECRQKGLVVSLARDCGASVIIDRLSILLSDPGDEMCRRVEWLGSYIEGLQHLFQAFAALSRPAEQARLSAKVTRFVTYAGEDGRQPTDLVRAALKGESLEARLAAAVELLHEIESFAWGVDRAEAFSLVRNLAESMLQELLGNGWGLRHHAGAGGEAHVRSVVDCLRRIAQGAGSEMPARELVALAAVLSATLLDPTQQIPVEAVSDQLPDRTSALHLMALWTGLNRRAHYLQSAGSEAQNSADEEWRQASGTTVMALAPLLIDWSKKATWEFDYIPLWLRLWFCHTLLTESGTDQDGEAPPASGARRWRLRRDIAYILRESLRARSYGRRSDYVFEPEAMAAALRTLVEHHAVRWVKLPWDHDLRRMLEDISGKTSSNSYFFAAGHLQHALEVYIAGQFLCDIRVRPRGEQADWTLAQVLASRSEWQPGSLTVGEFRKAFSLAALLHNVGRLLFPRWHDETDRLGALDRSLGKSLEEVKRSLRDAAVALMRRCEAELGGEGYYKRAAEPQVARWIEETIDRAETDIGLLGAWFLHRIFQGTEHLTATTLRQAVRAVLLRRVITQPIDVDVDPAAALLVLCDEIFTWDPLSTVPSSPDLGHAFHALAGDLKPQTSPYQSIRLHELRIEVVEEGPDRGRLIGRLDPAHGGGGAPDDSPLVGWPRFELALKDPESLDRPTYWVWLRLAQNLGRLQPAREGPNVSVARWAPSVRLRSAVPKRLAACNLDTYGLLERVADRCGPGIRPSLERWLGVTARFSRRPADEAVDLGWLGGSLHRDDIVEILPVLENLAREVIAQEWESLARALKSGPANGSGAPAPLALSQG